MIDLKKLEDFYARYTVQKGNTAGWSSLEAAMRTYRAASICEYQNWTEIRTVLDIGSGEGHFANYLRKERAYTGEYLGLEALTGFHKKALELFSEPPLTRFLQDEFFIHDFLDTRYDWLFSLGSLSLKQDEQEKHDRVFFQKIGKLARQGISIYINDRKLVPPERQAAMPDMAFYDLDDFIARMKMEIPAKEVLVDNFQISSYARGTMIHAIL